MENELLNNILELSQDKTTIIITHRVALCTKMDKIIFLKNGELNGIGSHTELIKNNNEYKSFYQAQQKWYTHSIEN